MGLKPSKIGAVLLQEQIRAKLSGSVSEAERVELEELASDIDAYLQNS